MLDIGDTWACAFGSSNGVPEVLRCRTNLASVVGCKSHSRLLRIIWRYEPTDASGLPSEDLVETMAVFENAIIAELERDLVAIFASMRVGNSIKEWDAYIADAQRACDRLNLALEAYDPFPIELTVEDDPSWGVYRSLLEMIESAETGEAYSKFLSREGQLNRTGLNQASSSVAMCSRRTCSLTI